MDVIQITGSITEGHPQAFRKLSFAVTDALGAIAQVKRLDSCSHTTDALVPVLSHPNPLPIFSHHCKCSICGSSFPTSYQTAAMALAPQMRHPWSICVLMPTTIKQMECL